MVTFAGENRQTRQHVWKRASVLSSHDMSRAMPCPRIYVVARKSGITVKMSILNGRTFLNCGRQTIVQPAYRPYGQPAKTVYVFRLRSLYFVSYHACSLKRVTAYPNKLLKSPRIHHGKTQSIKIHSKYNAKHIRTHKLRTVL